MMDLGKVDPPPPSLSFLFHKMNTNDFQTILSGAPKFLGICSDEKVVLGVKGLDTPF